MKSAPSLNQTS